MILALETATDICSVALERGGAIDEKRSQEHRSHSENLFLFIRELMQIYSFSLDELEVVLVSAGPGSYTGLRIAASGVKGLLFGSETPLISVSTLASFAWLGHRQAPDACRIHAVINARRKHLYHQSFTIDDGQLAALDEVAAKPIARIEETLETGDVLVGTGLQRLDEHCISKLHTLGKDAISAMALIHLYQQENNLAFLERITAQAFDPAYYSSRQIQ